MPHGTKVPFKRFKQKLHIQFLATPFAVPNQFMGRKKGAVDNLPKEFVRLYFVLYFTMAFLVRARRNNRYFGYLRKLRSERMAMAEVLPGNIGITSEAFGADIINLHMKKYEYLSKGLSGHLNNMNQELSQLRCALESSVPGRHRFSAAAKCHTTYRSTGEGVHAQAHRTHFGFPHNEAERLTPERQNCDFLSTQADLSGGPVYTAHVSHTRYESNKRLVRPGANQDQAGDAVCHPSHPNAHRCHEKRGPRVSHFPCFFDLALHFRRVL